jgi:hypothetical protein
VQIVHKHTRPQTTASSIERINRILLDECAYACPYKSETE